MCFVVTACLHLFFMAAFSWMLVEGLLLWSKVVAVNMSEDRRMKFYYATGWGIYRLICRKMCHFPSSRSFSRRDSRMFGWIQNARRVPLLCRGFLTFMCQITGLGIS